MLRYFPMPYPDGSIYSIFLRYDKKMKNDNYFVTLKDLTGDMYSIVSYGLTNKLLFLCNQLPKKSQYTPEFFIKNNMILPLYKPFVTANKYDEAIDNLKSGMLKSVMSSLGMTAGSICKINGFKYCPQCIDEDKKEYGKAYLHRLHQIDGNFICNKHKCLLQIFEPEDNSNNLIF